MIQTSCSGSPKPALYAVPVTAPGNWLSFRGMLLRSGARNSWLHLRQRNFLVFVRKIMNSSNPIATRMSSDLD
jgi:hypothetical protein